MKKNMISSEEGPETQIQNHVSTQYSCNYKIIQTSATASKGSSPAIIISLIYNYYYRARNNVPLIIFFSTGKWIQSNSKRASLLTKRRGWGPSKAAEFEEQARQGNE